LDNLLALGQSLASDSKMSMEPRVDRLELLMELRQLKKLTEVVIKQKK